MLISTSTPVTGIISLLLFYFLCCFSLQAEDQKRKALFSKGYIQYKRKAFRKAILFFQKAYNHTSSTAQDQRIRQALRYFLGKCHVELRQYSQARKFLSLYLKGPALRARWRTDAKKTLQLLPQEKKKPSPPPSSAKKELSKPSSSKKKSHPKDKTSQSSLPAKPTLPPKRVKTSVHKPPKRVKTSVHKPEKRVLMVKTPVQKSQKTQGNPLQIVAYSALISGGLCLLAAIGVNLYAAQQYGEAERIFAQGPSQATSAQSIVELQQNAQNASTVSVVFYSLSAVGLISGLTLLFLHRPKAQAKQRSAPPTRNKTQQPTQTFLFHSSSFQ